MRFLGLALLASVWLYSCNKEATKGNHRPEIKFLLLTPSEFKNGSPNDTIKIAFEFFDKDGDVGSTGGNDPANIFIYQTFDSTAGESLLPVIPPQFEENPEGVKGTAWLAIPTAFYTLDSARLQTGDTFHFIISIKDRAGNMSDSFTTSDVIVKP